MNGFYWIFFFSFTSELSFCSELCSCFCTDVMKNGTDSNENYFLKHQRRSQFFYPHKNARGFYVMQARTFCSSFRVHLHIFCICICEICEFCHFSVFAALASSWLPLVKMWRSYTLLFSLIVLYNSYNYLTMTRENFRENKLQFYMHYVKHGILMW